MSLNKTKDKLLSGDMAVGSEILFPSPEVAEILSYAGLDFIYIDMEHSATGYESLSHIVRATEIGGATPLVRLPEDPAGLYGPQIMRVLDIGSMGVIIPHVDTAEVASEVASATKYSPLGTRGMFSGGRQSGYGFRLSAPEYVAAANDAIMTVVMIESIVGVKNLDEILAVSGIDVILVGSSDLAQSLGYPGKLTENKVLDTIAGVIEKCKSVGVTSGVGAFASFPEQHRTDFLKLGARFVNVNANNLISGAAVSWSTALREQYRQAAG